jgi:hypothetical protein
MKTKYLTIVFALGLLTIISGAYILTSTGQTPYPATIKFDPRFVDMDSTYPYIWSAEIRAPTGSGWNVKDINPDTIRIEGYIPIIPGSMYYYKGAQTVQFKGQAVWNLLLAKINHLGVPPDASTNTPVHYDFIVTGNLINGEAFSSEGGQCWIAVRFPLGLPPPPP